MARSDSTYSDSLLWNGVFWSRLIYPEHSPEGLYAHASAPIAEDFPEYIVCLAIDDYVKISSEEAIELVQRIGESIKSNLQSDECVRLGFTHSNAFYFGGTGGGGKVVRRRIETLRAKLSLRFELSCTAGVAFLKERSMEALQDAARYSVVAQRRKMQEGCGRVYLFDQSYLSQAFSFSAYWETTKRLCDLVESGDARRAAMVVSEAARELFGESYLPLNHLRPILQTQIILMSQSASGVGVAPDIVMAGVEEYLQRIGATYDYIGLKHTLEQSTLAFAQMVRDMIITPQGRLVLRAEEIIRDRLCDPSLGLRSIANKLKVHPSYLSRTFKRQKRQGLSDYVNMLRIERATRLLMDSDNGVAEIAFSVGFGSIQSFGRAFKSRIGCSPREYRRSKNVQSKSNLVLL